MIITFGATNLAGADTETCFDQPRGFTLGFTDVVQVANLVRSAKPNLHHRGNRVYTGGWSVARQHEDVAAAEAFVQAHVLLFDEADTLDFGDLSLTAVVTCRCSYKGATSVTEYQITGVEVAA